MANISFICAGRVKESYYKDACAEYIKRIGAFRKAEIIEIAEERGETDAALQKEAEAITRQIPQNAFVIAMCIEGNKLSSGALADLTQKSAQTKPHIAVIIGSSNGLHESVKAAADYRLSMSDMTFPHSLARVMALEQFYRAFSIQNGGKYHK